MELNLDWRSGCAVDLLRLELMLFGRAEDGTMRIRGGTKFNNHKPKNTVRSRSRGKENEAIDDNRKENPQGNGRRTWIQAGTVTK